MYLNANYLSQQHAKLFENSSDFNNFIQCLNSVSIITKFCGSLAQNCLQLDKDKNTVSTFSVIFINKYVVITIQKSSYVESFNFGQQRFVFAYLLLNISIKLTKLYFQN